MNARTKKTLRLILVLVLLAAAIWYGRGEQPAQPLSAAQVTASQITETQETLPSAENIDEDGSYTTKEDVALYLHSYGRLPNNFVTKAQARKSGWSGGSLEKYLPGCCIGGDKFGNREGLLPQTSGRQYYECDIDSLGADERGAKRIVYSDDGLIYYTDDHYQSFTLLYGEG